VESYFRQDHLPTPDGASLYFQIHGDGHPGLLLCDGLGCDGFAWKYLLADLKQRHQAIRWHYRGHGRSGLPKDLSRIGMTHHCEDLGRVMDAAGLEDAVIFGHSMGVQVALEFHRLFPRRVKALVLICGSFGNPLDTFHDGTLLKTAFPYLNEMVVRFPTVSKLFTRVILKTELAVQFALFTELNRQLMKRDDLIPYFEHLADMDLGVFMRTLKSVAEHSAWDHLPEINVPTLVIGGEKDRFTPLWLSRKMAAAIPEADFFIIPGGSHTAPLEEPVMVWDRIRRFLETRVQSSNPAVRAASR
jgi:pimeloyl-ACP methyl ester carboxylesterase